MAARSVRVLFENTLQLNLRLTSASLDHGIWTEPWRPPQLIGNAAEWRSESSGIGTGTEGRVSYNIENVDGVVVGNLSLHWDNPFIGSNSYDESASPAGEKDGSGFSVVHLGGGGDDATVTFKLYGGFCEADPDTGEVICTSEQSVTGADGTLLSVRTIARMKLGIVGKLSIRGQVLKHGATSLRKQLAELLHQ